MPVSYANLVLKRLRVRLDHLVVLLLRRVGLPCWMSIWRVRGDASYGMRGMGGLRFFFGLRSDSSSRSVRLLMESMYLMIAGDTGRFRVVNIPLITFLGSGSRAS